MVGLLAHVRSQPEALRLVFLENRATSPGRWELEWDDVSISRQELQSRGLRAIGLFHSHPVSPAILGARDRRSTPTGWLHLVYDVCALDPRLYRIRQRGRRRELQELVLITERSRR